MLVERIKKFIREVREHPNISPIEELLITNIEILISDLSNTTQVNGTLLNQLKQVYAHRWNGAPGIHPGIKDTLNDYTFDPRGLNELWIQLAYELSELKILIYILPSLPVDYNLYLNCALLIDSYGEEKDRLFLVNDRGEVEPLKLRNSKQFRKNLSDTSAIVYSISYERLSRMLACNDVHSSMISNYLQILIPDVQNVFSLDKINFLTDSPRLTKIFFVDSLPINHDFSFCNHYVFLKSKNVLYYYKESTRSGFLEYIQLPLQDLNKFIQDIETKKGPQSVYELTRSDLKKIVTTQTGHLPFELRNFYLGEDDKTLFKLSDLDENSNDSKRLFATYTEKGKEKLRFVTIKEFFRIRSKCGAYSCRNDNIVNIWHLFKVQAFRDFLFPKYYLVDHEPIDIKDRSCIGFKYSETHNLLYTHRDPNGLVQKGHIARKHLNMQYPLTKGAIRDAFPLIIKTLLSRKIQLLLPELPVGELLPTLLNMVKLYIANPVSNNEEFRRQAIKNKLDYFLFQMSNSSIIDINYLYGQSIVCGEKKILLVDILIDLYVYANRFVLSPTHDQWGQTVDANEGVILTLRDKLFGVARWLCLQDASLVIHDPLFLSVYSQLELGPALTWRKLYKLISNLLNTESLVPRENIESILLRMRETSNPSRMSFGLIMPMLKELYRLRWQNIRSRDFERYNYTRQPEGCNAHWVYLAQVLSGTEYFEKSRQSNECISYYRFLMPTLTSDINPVLLSRLEYYPLSYYIYPDSDVSFLVSLINSENSVRVGGSFTNVDCHQMPFSHLEYQRINAAHARFHKYVPFLGYELQLNVPQSNLSPNVIYLDLTQNRLHYSVLNTVGKVCTGVINKTDLDLEYELYLPIRLDLFSPFLLDIVDALERQEHAHTIQKEPRISMSTVLALHTLVNTTLNARGLEAPDVSSTERTTMEVGYEVFANVYHNLSEFERIALGKQRVNNLNGTETFDEMLQAVQRIVPNREDRGCAAVVARGILKIVVAYIPYAEMTYAIETDPRINLAMLRQRIQKKYVKDSHGEAVRNIRNLLVSMLIYPFDEVTGNRIKLWEFTHRINPKVQVIFKELISLLTDSNYERARYLNTLVMHKLIPELIEKMQSMANQYPYARDLESPALGRSAYELSENSDSLFFSDKTLRWLRSVQDGTVNTHVHWYPPHQLFLFFLDVFAKKTNVYPQWRHYLCREEIESLMDLTLNVYLQTDSYLSKEVRVNILFNKYLQRLSADSRADFCALLDDYVKVPMQNTVVIQSAYEYLTMRLTQLSGLGDISLLLGDCNALVLSDIVENILTKIPYLSISQPQKQLMINYLADLKLSVNLDPIADDYYEPNSFSWAPFFSAVRNYMPNIQTLFNQGLNR